MSRDTPIRALRHGPKRSPAFRFTRPGLRLLARDFGGLMAVSLSQTVLAQREQFHQDRLVDKVASWNPFYYDTLNRIEAYFRTHAFTGNEVGTSVAYIGQMVQTQVAILAYIDVFWALAVVAAVMVPLSLSLRAVKRAAGGGHAL